MRSGLAAFLCLVVVGTAAYAESAFSNYGNSTVTAVQDYGSKRGIYKPFTKVGQELNVDEQAKVAMHYAALVGSGGRAPSGTVSSLAWQWGMCSKTVRNIFFKFKYGATVFSQTGRSTGEKIMDILANNEAVIKILVDKKGRVSGRRLQVAFKNMTGIAVSRQTLVRHLKTMNLEIARRRYCPKISPTHKQTRHRFGSKYLHDNFDRWIDLDEKWYLFILPLFF